MRRSIASKPCYQELYDSNRAAVLACTGWPSDKLKDMATELQVDYEVFLSDYCGEYLADAHVGFLEMLRLDPPPWPYLDGSSLNGLSLAQFFLAWSWSENEGARYCLDGDAQTHGWSRDDAVEVGVVSAVSAAKSLAYAMRLMSTGDTTLGQERE